MKSLYGIFIMLTCIYLLLLSIVFGADLQETVMINNHPSLTIEYRPLCLFPDVEDRHWYKVENDGLSIQAVVLKENESSDSVASRLSFLVKFKTESSNGQVKTLSFSCPYFGPLYSLLLNNDQFVATGCIGSHSDYIYVAENTALNQGIGITCMSPVISPKGRYIFFHALLARQPPAAACFFIMDLHEKNCPIYRVFPLDEGISEQIQLESYDLENQWFWTPPDTIYNCYDAKGNSHRPGSPVIWSANEEKIAFMDRVVSDMEEYQRTFEFVVLDFSNGLIVPVNFMLPINFKIIIAPERAARPFSTPKIGIRWIDDNSLEVNFSSGEVKLQKTKFRLDLNSEQLLHGKDLEFFDVAEALE